MKMALGVLWLLLAASMTSAQSLPDGYWNDEQVGKILEKTIFLKLNPDLSHLSASEQSALSELMAAGELLHELYLLQRHEQSLSALRALDDLPDSNTKSNLQKLFWLFKGPIATTLDNARQPFLPVPEEWPGKAVYPAGLEKSTMDGILRGQPNRRRELLAERAVVRVATAENLAKHRKTLQNYPVLATLHGDFVQRLSNLSAGDTLYAVPNAVEYAERVMKVFDRLNVAANYLEQEDADFAAYLRNRARDLLSCNYESGDASWVTGKFKNLNAQIGSYETYDDSLFGVKAFYSMSILARDPQKSANLAEAIKGIQKIEDSLPYKHQKRVRENIPVHVCNVIADFGQARGTNTATILPNDANHSRKYGRTILLRYNIMTHPALFDLSAQRFRLAVSEPFRRDLSLQSTFQRTLWHEVGHYLGVDKTEDGRDLDAALQEYSDLFEEMKADLVSLFAAKKLSEAGVHSADDLRSIYAGGILRVLQLVKPRPDQPYQTMQLIQWNYFLEDGLLRYENGELSIDYEKYPTVVESLLREVLEIQRSGNPRRASEFVEKYTTWDDSLHEVIASRLRSAATYRYRHVSYGVMDE